MIRSMTGYGKGQATVGEVSLTVEVKSVNHRYSDVSVKLPRSLLALEGDIKKRVAERLRRGKADVYINQESVTAANSVPTLNPTLASAYVEVFETLRREFPVEGKIPLALLAEQRDVIVVREADLPEEQVHQCLQQALDSALEAAQRMRETEGKATRLDMEGHIAQVVALLAGIEERAPLVPREWQAKLQERLERLQQDFEYDAQRVAQEIALFADRCDISEEIARFKSHLQQFDELFESREPVGRQMDFLVQELNREVNTMGSKSNDVELTRRVVGIKAELEKIREQVQNIE